MLILFVANTVQTITGFAGNLLAMPPSIRLIGPESASAVINVFTVVACLIIAVRNRRYIRVRILVKMVALMLVGMAIGAWLLKAVAFDLLPSWRPTTTETPLSRRFCECACPWLP